MTKYYLQAHYPESLVSEKFEGTLDSFFEQITNDLNDPENFTYTISDKQDEPGDRCAFTDIEIWARGSVR